MGRALRQARKKQAQRLRRGKRVPAQFHTGAHRSEQKGSEAQGVSRGQVHEGPETTQSKKFRFDNLQAKGAIRGEQ